jgi:glucosamine--fructose-6-phosphate aminotransferase (isomerizing)
MEKTSINVKAIIKENEHTIDRIVSRYITANDFYFIGRGSNYFTASEGALKLKEVSYIHAEAMCGGELKHGTLALVRTDTPCVVIAPKDETYDDIISNASEAQARGATIIGVSHDPSSVFDYHIKTSDDPISEIIALQLLAYKMSIARGYNPDKPRNLAKSVTVK